MSFQGSCCDGPTPSLFPHILWSLGTAELPMKPLVDLANVKDALG
jgi:hypothetical protein